MGSSNRKQVNSKEDLLSLMFELLDENDAVEWENDTAYQYIQAMAAWLNDSDGFYQNQGEPASSHQPSWQLLADMLQAGRIYE